EGFFDVFTSAQALDCNLAINDLGTKPEVLRNMPKLHACCAAIHAGVDVVLDKLQQGETEVADIAHIQCEVSYHALNQMRYALPESVSQARFSIPYCIAAALVFGKLGVHQFTEASIAHPAVQALMPKISVSILPEFSTQAQFQPAHDAGKAYTRIAITHASGKICTMQRDHQKGFPDSPLSEQDFHTKFADCLATGFPAEASEQLWNNLMRLEHLPCFPWQAIQTSP